MATVTEEDYLHAQIRALQDSYMKAIKPYVDRLVDIESMKPKPTVFINVEDIDPEMLRTLQRRILP